MFASKPVLLLAAGMIGAAALGSGDALAQRGRGGDNFGDTYINDAQKNPRFIEPGAENDPARYRIGAPYEGWVDRQMAARGYYDPGSGYAPAPRRGRVYVHPNAGYQGR
ncbi:hypothetical protein [Enterovirga aerilata]|uniref:BA14K family protein n=1 Tax=Enterovirga aerilata TaxID=2730920 RepID=A0A849I885_9HYPH|nr:hypothetical protein [Enterovirga sp. DB1703]NNM73994.1 hypothetical protein [Enterovirga sp. DB1703]